MATNRPRRPKAKAPPTEALPPHLFERQAVAGRSPSNTAMLSADETKTALLRMRADHVDRLVRLLIRSFRGSSAASFERVIVATYGDPFPAEVISRALHSAMALGVSNDARRRASGRNQEHITIARREWALAKRQGCSKADFSRTFSARLKREHQVSVTPETVAERWLKGS